jgi:5-methylcytosine-specific restriction protein A
LCEEHLRKGLVVDGNCCDHIIPEAEGGDSEPANLQWLCDDCHNTKTKAEAKRGVQRGSTRGGAG